MRDENAQEHGQADDAPWEELPLGKGGLSRRALSRLLTIILAGLLVIATAVIVISGSVRLPTSSLGDAASPTALPLPPGWRHAGPGFGDMIAFSPQAPTTLYTCASAHHHIILSVSHDSGGRWQTATLAMPGDDCLVSSNPYDNHELAIEVRSGCTLNCGWQLYRSFDAGQQWQQAIMPSQFPHFANLVWTKDALFVPPDYGTVYPTPPATTVAHTNDILAVSRNHGPFSWATIPIAPDLLNPIPLNSTPPFFADCGAIDNTVYLGFQKNTDSQITTIYFQSSDDGGDMAYAFLARPTPL